MLAFLPAFYTPSFSGKNQNDPIRTKGEVFQRNLEFEAEF